MAGVNLGSLFGSSSSGNMYSDYAAIRNGSYKRLLKSYYGDSKSSYSSSSKNGTKTSSVLDRMIEERKHPVESETVQTANSKLGSGVGTLKNALAKLQKDDTYKADEDKTIEEKSVSALKDFVSTYNSVISAAKKSTNSGMTHHVADMMKATGENADALGEIGISVKSDGTLYLNETKAKATDWQNTKALFSSEDRSGYGYKVNAALTGAGYYAASISSSSSADSSEGTKDASDTVKDTASYYGDLKNNIEALKAGEYDTDELAALATDFANNYNSLLSSARLSTNSGVAANLNNMISRTKENQGALSDIGISIDKNGNLSVNDKKLKSVDADTAKKTLKSYVSAIETSASLVKYYATTNAGTSSGYTSGGAYNTGGIYASSYTSPFQA